MNTTIQNKIQLGEAWLDEIYPHWYKVIDTEKLNMASNTKCILGQLYTSFHMAVAQLNKQYEEMRNYGLLGLSVEQEYELTHEWRNVIERKKNHAQ